MPFIEFPPESIKDPAILRLHMLHLRKELEVVSAIRRDLWAELNTHEEALQKLLADSKREHGAWDAVQPEDIHWRPGYEKLNTWFSLTYASWLTLPRSLMEAMPDRWQRQMAELLEAWSDTWVNWPEGWSSRVQVTRDGKLIKTPEVLINYRHPRQADIEALRTKEPQP